MIDVEKISIKKFAEEAKKLEEKYDVRLDIYRAENSIRGSFIRKISVENDGLDIEKLVSNDDWRKLNGSVDTFAEAKNVVKPYLKKNSKDMRIDQLNYVSLSSDLLESEAKKIGLTAWDIRWKNDVPIGKIEDILMKKTEKFVTINVGDMTYNYKMFRELQEVFLLVCGLETNIDGQRYNESIKAYEDRLNAQNPMIIIKPFQNGKMRFTIKNKQIQEHFRHFLVEKEIQSIVRSRQSRW